jgi:archaellum component FlaC
MKKEPMTMEKLGVGIAKINEKLEAIDKRFEVIDKRFDGVDTEIRGLGVLIEDMDSRFTTISEGQDIIREVLETRVAHIEEILEIEATV